MTPKDILGNFVYDTCPECGVMKPCRVHSPEPDAVPTQKKAEDEMPESRLGSVPDVGDGDLPRRKTRASDTLFEREIVIAKAEFYAVGTNAQAEQFIEDHMRGAYALGHREGYEKAIKEGLKYQEHVQRERS